MQTFHEATLYVTPSNSILKLSYTFNVFSIYHYNLFLCLDPYKQYNHVSLCKYISIGNACNVKYQIDKHRGKKETLFFDWLMTDMFSVISILNSYNNIDELLNFANIIKCPDNPTHGNYSRILIKSLPFCVSIHDIGIDVTEKDINKFIEKYKRRLNRIVNYIKSNEKIYFLRFGYIDDNMKSAFFQTIKAINPNCNFALISINQNENNNCINKEEHFLEINLIKPDIAPPDDWTTSYLDWKQIFLNIEAHI